MGNCLKSCCYCCATCYQSGVCCGSLCCILVPLCGLVLIIGGVIVAIVLTIVMLLQNEPEPAAVGRMMSALAGNATDGFDVATDGQLS